mmetsp:Transcript_33184/g.98823  ORF Transcript_33184/g.98823 Transcript_33184/m.98823 type:complete len:83 (+) Transcript_33184:517-765(+)
MEAAPEAFNTSDIKTPASGAFREATSRRSAADAIMATSGINAPPPLSSVELMGRVSVCMHARCMPFVVPAACVRPSRHATAT